jgi:copper(I)-binding protein
MIHAMKHRRLFALGLAGILAATAAVAQDFQLGPLKIDQLWARPTVAGQSAGGGFLSIQNSGSKPDRLLGGRSPAAAAVEVHEMRMEGDVMRMREIKALELPAGKRVTLAPGGFHLMLVGLKAPLKIGDKVPVKLRFEAAGDVDVVFQVANKAAPAGAMHKD